MPRHPCLRLFPVLMLQPKCRLSENHRATDWGSHEEAATQLPMKRLMCPQLETAEVRWRRVQANSPFPRWEKARDFLAGPTRPRGLPFPTRFADLSLVAAKPSLFR